MTQLFIKVFNQALTASLLIAAVILVRFLLKKAPKWIPCALWGLVALKLILPVRIESILSLVPSAEPIPADIEYSAAPHIESGIPAVNHAVNPALMANFAPQPESSANPLQIVLFLCAVVWIAGMAALCLYSAITYLILRKKVAASVRISGNTYVCDEVAGPFILGVISPRIYLPSGLSDGTRECVLEHERAHLARRDHLWKPLGFLILTVYWFQPLCWVAYLLLCKDIELACDEKVTRNKDKDWKAAYCQALLDCNAGRRLVAACPVAFGEVGVKERVKSVLNYRKPAFWVMLAAAAAAAAVTVCFMTAPKEKDSVPEDTPALTETADEEKTADAAKPTDETKPAGAAKPEDAAKPAAEAPNETQVSLDRLPGDEYPMTLLFASGAGAWGTEILLQADGSFEGRYDDSDAHDHYFCDFKGRFGQLKRLGDTAVTMQLEELTILPVKAEEWTEGEVRYIASEPYGMEKGTEFVLYLPETPVEGLDEEFLSWWPNWMLGAGAETDPPSTLSCYGLCNVETGYGFFLYTPRTVPTVWAEGRFDNVMGYSGYYTYYDEGIFPTYGYYCADDGTRLAYVWGTEPEDVGITDLDGDGKNELIAGVIWGDGAMNVVIYKEFAEGIRCAYCDELIDEKYDHIGVGALQTVYLKDTGEVKISYWVEKDRKYYDKTYRISDLDKMTWYVPDWRDGP